MGWLAEVRWADLARVRMPTLIVWGDQDVLFSRADQDVLLAALPHARLVVYEGTGHTPHWEEPRRFARDLEAFLRTSVPMAA
jgi:pimeloyl-ACP methyl ester carboxylesterase